MIKVFYLSPHKEKRKMRQAVVRARVFSFSHTIISVLLTRSYGRIVINLRNAHELARATFTPF